MSGGTSEGTESKANITISLPTAVRVHRRQWTPFVPSSQSSILPKTFLVLSSTWNWGPQRTCDKQEEYYWYSKRWSSYCAWAAIHAVSGGNHGIARLQHILNFAGSSLFEHVDTEYLQNPLKWSELSIPRKSICFQYHMMANKIPLLAINNAIFWESSSQHFSGLGVNNLGIQLQTWKVSTIQAWLNTILKLQFCFMNFLPEVILNSSKGTTCLLNLLSL